MANLDLVGIGDLIGGDQSRERDAELFGDAGEGVARLNDVFEHRVRLSDLEAGGAVEGAPEVPGGDGGVGTPGLGDLLHLAGCGRDGEFIGLVNGVADAEVARGEDVGAFEGEDEEHLDGPDADAFDGGEGGEDVGIGEGGEAGEGDAAGGEVEDVGGFLLGEAEGAETRGAEGDEFGGGEFAAVAGGGKDAGEDGGGGFSAELLVDDGAGEGGEVGGVVGYGVGSDLANDGAEDGVRGFEMEEGFFHGNAKADGRIKQYNDTPHATFSFGNHSAGNGATETSGEGG